MSRLLYGVVWLFWRTVLSLRYRLHLHGAEHLTGVPGPILILPNHPGYIDPALLITSLWPALHPRPLLFEGGFFRNPIIHAMARLLRAVLVPDLEHASAQARARANAALDEAITGLRRGENFIIWPSGRVQRDGVERLGGARAAAEVLRAVPEARVLLIRSRGIWGSMFGYARTGEAPNPGSLFWKSLGLLLANLLVFMPRRHVHLTLEFADRAQMPEPKRELLNPWLEAWYNAPGPESPTFVPYHFLFGPRTYEFPRRSGLAGADLSKVKPETKAEVAEILGQKLKRSLTPHELQPDTPLDQLGLDSLDSMEIALTIEQRFGFSGEHVPLHVGELWALAEGLIERAPPKPAPPLWARPPSDDGIARALGNTIPEAFIARALANPKDVAAADDIAGVLTYERLLVGALTLSRRFAQLPGANVGLLLPASVACDIAFLALHLAGKLPVLLNWTTGPANLAHAARLMQLEHVVSSHAFLDRAAVTIEGVRFVHLEDLRQTIGRWELLRTLLTARFLPGRVRRSVPAVAPEKPAVVLFTSGSERAPKAVPLTHANLLNEMRLGAPFLNLTRRQVLLGFLPAFHSFGIAVGCVLPLLGGLRVVHHPDPTDASGLARKIAAYKPTLLVGTPTFVTYILERAKPGELDSLRLVVVGAERCPPALYDLCGRTAPDANLLEGYGITECSPVVAVNRPTANRPGTVGQPLPELDTCIVGLDTEQVMGSDQLGMLWVSGPTVFPGYLGYDGPSPFRERAGKHWYVTGDLATISQDRFITLAGRLKRFLKAGGEMISLPALEEPLAAAYPPTDKGPRVAVEGIETDKGRLIVLFTTEPIALADANALLLGNGFRGVMRLDEIRRVERIPLLGTGKTDYKVLRAQLQDEQNGASHKSV